MVIPWENFPLYLELILEILIKTKIGLILFENKPVSTMAGQAASRDTINTCLCFRKRSI